MTSDSQSDFVPVRLVSDNISMAYKLFYTVRNVRNLNGLSNGLDEDCKKMHGNCKGIDLIQGSHPS